MEENQQSRPIVLPKRRVWDKADMLESEKRTVRIICDHFHAWLVLTLITSTRPQQPKEINPAYAEGMCITKIRAWRRQYVECLFHVGRQLRMPPWAIATAILYCHKFFSLKSINKNDRFLIASACLHLGAKVQEAPKSIKDVIRECDAFRFSGNAKKQSESLNDSLKMEERKEEVLMAERAVLYTLGFTLDDKNAFSLLLNYLGELGLAQSSTDESSPIDKRFTHLLQPAWDMLSESYRTQLCLVLEPRKLASAAIFMADLANQKQPGAISIVQLINEKETLKNSGEVHDFCSYFDISPSEIELFSDEVLAVYTPSSNEARPSPMMDCDEDDRPQKRKLEEVGVAAEGEEEPSGKRIRVATAAEPEELPEELPSAVNEDGGSVRPLETPNSVDEPVKQEEATALETPGDHQDSSRISNANAGVE